MLEPNPQEEIDSLAREKQLNELKYDFLNTITHEFKTPLTSILGYSELLKDNLNDSDLREQLIYLGKIQDKVQHMTQMLDDLVTIEEAQSGTRKFAPEPVNLKEFCDALIEDFQRSIGHDRELKLTISAKLPQLSLDRKLLHNILGNLLSNAIKYSPPQSEIVCTVNFDGDDRLTLQVRDRGIGIPIEQQPYLFNSFYRADNVGKIPGTGLGLAIVQKSVNLHGGEIFVQSEVNMGTLFTVVIPIDRSSLAP
jgi:signal transduction histidine kinase